MIQLSTDRKECETEAAPALRVQLHQVTYRKRERERERGTGRGVNDIHL